MYYPILKISEWPKHHFFGFHDLIQSNANNKKILSLETSHINRPPLPGEKISVGYFNKNELNHFIEIGNTNAFNYPQGSRQQWIGVSDLFISNNQVDNEWGANIFDTTNNKNIGSINCPIHCLSHDKKTGFSFNYSRVQRLGGYGYIGIEDKTANEAAPLKDGIFINDIESNTSKLLISINEIASINSLERNDKTHHYITHLRLNPGNSRLAFLHRYFLADGGFMTRLMTIGTDGTQIRCLGSGFLSHFDWMDDQNIIIYGRTNKSIDNLRGNYLFSNPISKRVIRQIKGGLRKVFSNMTNQMEMSFLMIQDLENGIVRPFAKDKIIEDGHPMVNPRYKDWIINDTYPDNIDCRTLMLYNIKTNERFDLGKFCFKDKKVEMFLQNQFFKGIDKNVLKNINPNATAFFRSGLHCDLHPRWLADGKTAAFDSIHEGFRSIYLIDLSLIIKCI